MNKIYKLVWSKVRNTWVVASEIAKGHGKNSSSERSRTILKSVILMALLGSFLTAGMPSVSALTQEEEDSIVNAIIQRLETEKKIPHYLSINVPKYEASKLNYNNDAAVNDLYGIAIGAETQTNEEGIAIGRGAKIYKGTEWRDFGTGKLLWPESRQYSMNPLQEVDAEKFRGEYDIHYTRGRNGIAIGTSAQVYEAMGIAIGYNAQASAPDQNSAVAPQVAIGAFAEASGVDAIAIGTGATSRMYGGVSIGYGAFNYGQGYYGIAIGEFSRTEKEGGIALGYRAMAQGGRSLALGWYTRALYSDGVALGNGSVLDRGPTSHAYLDDSPAVKRTMENQLSPVSIGNSRQGWGTAENKNFPKPPPSKRQLVNLAAGTEDSDAVNVAQLKAAEDRINNRWNHLYDNQVHYFSISAADKSLGSNYYNKGTRDREHAMAIGENAIANDYSLALGHGATNRWETAFDENGPKKATNYYSMSFLEERLGLSRFEGETEISMVRGSHSLAIGDRASTNDTMGIAIGYKATTGVYGESNSVAPQIAIGALAEATGWSTVAMGTGATAESNDSIAIGTGAYTKKRDHDDIHSMAFGTYSRTEGTESMSFGHHAKALADRSIAFGAGSEATAGSGVALGYSSVADRERSLNPYLEGEGKVSETVYGTLGAVSIGNPNEPYEYDNIRVGWSTTKGTRQLINLAAGSADTDAVNVAQLKVVDKKVDHLWTQFNMAGPHYFSVSALTRDRISNYNNDATDGSERALAIGEDVYANDYSVAIGYGAVNHDWKAKNTETGQFERVKNVYDMSGLAQRLDSDYIRRETTEFKNIGSHSVAIGDHAETNQTMSVAVGYKAKAGRYSVVKDNVMPQIAIGALANASGDSTIALGTGATATTNDSIAIGTGAHVQPINIDKDIYSMSLGAYSLSTGTENMALGHYAKALSNQAVAIGAGTASSAPGGVALGYSSVANRMKSLDPYLKGEGNVSDTVYGELGAVSIGNPYEPAEYDNLKKSWSTQRGTRQLTNLAAGSEDSDAVNVAQLRVIDDKKANLDASNLTKASDKSAWATALGTGTVTQNDANLVTGDTVYQYIKTNAKATKVTVDGKEDKTDGNLKIKKTEKDGQLTYDLTLNNEITLGKKGTPGADGAPGKDGVDGKIGINGKDGRSAEITVGKGKDGVDGKNGEDGITRIIYTDEKGETRQVATLDDGLKFKGDNDTVVTRKLNTQLNITGGAKTDLSENNIGVTGNANGSMLVQLAKNLKGLSRAEFKDGDKVTNITAQTITQKDGDNITNIKAGDVSVTRKEVTQTKQSTFGI